MTDVQTSVGDPQTSVGTGLPPSEAARKIQAIQRGRQARKHLAASNGRSNGLSAGGVVEAWEQDEGFVQVLQDVSGGSWEEGAVLCAV